jgi:NAD(P)-dependent dehydrogenase (short-subunit alcohol dehydrogenase family)
MDCAVYSPLIIPINCIHPARSIPQTNKQTQSNEMSTTTKLALVTGANKGIGYEIALSLSTTHKFHVLVAARKQQEGEQAVESIKNKGGSVEFIQLDVTDDKTIEAARDTIAKKYGKLDVLINNAGLISKSESLRTNLQETYNVNVFGPAVLIETFTELLEKSDHPRIVNVSSELGSITSTTDPNNQFYTVKHTVYNSSKTALNALTINYAYHLEKKKIKVNTVDPGYTATDLNGNSGYRTPQEAAESVIRPALIEDDGPTGKFYAIDGSFLGW